MTVEKPVADADLEPLVIVRGRTIELRGWRDISLINLAAVFFPAALGTVALFCGGLWRLIALGMFAFSAYGCWAIARGATAFLKLDDEVIVIDGRRIGKIEIMAFEGRRVREPSGLDDVEGSSELRLKLKNGAEFPIVRMSGAARIERIARYLNNWLKGQEDEH